VIELKDTLIESVTDDEPGEHLGDEFSPIRGRAATHAKCDPLIFLGEPVRRLVRPDEPDTVPTAMAGMSDLMIDDRARIG
jgi:hypothetical protein